jgi:hypothetical protein
MSSDLSFHDTRTKNQKKKEYNPILPILIPKVPKEKKKEREMKPASIAGW